MDANMAGKVCLITGASNGIGKEAACALAAMGATVVMVARDRARGEAALAEARQRSGSEQLHLLLADLSSLDDVRRLAESFRERYDRLDGLLNNAGAYNATRSTTTSGCSSRGPQPST